MTRTETTEFEDLDALTDNYDIVGELGGRRGARTWMARRRDTGADVLVSVFRQPEQDEGNALSHLASDANRLAEHAHHSLVRVHEARWLGDDALAVITDRVRFPSLEELLIRRDEAFSCPRVATILRDVNGALEWAREQKIVHRHVDPSGIFVEPGSDRILISFGLRPLPLADMPGPEADARTIATLARAMLTRSVADPERDRLPLGEVRPGLPDRLIEMTAQLLEPDPNAPVPDVSEYIAVVAMSDNLKRAEIECAETTRKLLEEERVAREKIEAERGAAEQAAAEQARLFQLEREAFSRERANIFAELEKQRQILERERAALARERAEHQQDRELLVREREEHRRWADEVEKAFAAQKAALKQQQRDAQDCVAEERSQIDAVVEERVAKELALRAPKQRDGTPVEPPLMARLTARGRKAKRKDKDIAVPLGLPARPKPHRVKPQWVRSLSHAWSDARERMPRPKWRRSWNVPAAAVAVLLLVAVSAFAIVRARDGGQRVAPVASAARVTDSAAGRVERPAAARPANPTGLPADFVNSVRREREAGIPADFIAGVRARAGGAAQGTYSEGEGGMIVYTPPRRTEPARRPAPTPSRPAPIEPRPQPVTPRVDTVITPNPIMPILPMPPLPPDTLRMRPDTIPGSGNS